MEKVCALIVSSFTLPTRAILNRHYVIAVTAPSAVFFYDFRIFAALMPKEAA